MCVFNFVDICLILSKKYMHFPYHYIQKFSPRLFSNTLLLASKVKASKGDITMLG